jgi:hypothetical protein
MKKLLAIVFLLGFAAMLTAQPPNPSPCPKFTGNYYYNATTGVAINVLLTMTGAARVGHVEIDYPVFDPAYVSTNATYPYQWVPDYPWPRVTDTFWLEGGTKKSATYNLILVEPGCAIDNKKLYVTVWPNIAMMKAELGDKAELGLVNY